MLFKTHFIGIGGIGMAGLAEVLARKGVEVQGSDLQENDNTERLANLGATFFKGHAAHQLGDAKRVIVSSAIKEDNPELVAAQEQGLEILHRGELLAEVITDRPSIVTVGSHGKTSTTALIWSCLNAGGTPPGLINGGTLHDLGTNAALGEQWWVVEADESDGSFLKLHRHVAIITNIEPEHMDYYGSEENLHNCFRQFIQEMPEDSLIVLCADQPEVMALEAVAGNRHIITYGFTDGAAYRAREISGENFQMVFDLLVRDRAVGHRLSLNLPGKHYVQNALAAIAVADHFGVPLENIIDALATFGGVGKRFHVLGSFDKATVVDDYGHHPTEIKATLEAARPHCKGRLIAVVEPHRYTRLQDHMAGFAESVEQADTVIVLPVYAASESPIDGVDHFTLAAKMVEQGHKQVFACSSDTLNDTLHDLDLSDDDLILFLGAGESSGLAKKLAA